MNWIFPLSKGSGPLRPLTSLQEQRQRQIESLKTAHSNLAEIQKDVEYRIPFTINNTTISINILLPPQFPQEKPSVSVYPHIRHHLVDSHNGTMVTSPLITNFTMHSDLGKIIQSIMDEFWNNPPVLASGSSGFAFMYNKPSGIPPYPPQGFHFPAFPQQEASRPVAPAPMQIPGTDSMPAPPLGFNITRPVAPAYGLITDLPLPVPTADSLAGLNGYTYKMPEIPETFQELSELSTSQLKDMSDQEDVLLEHFVCLPQLKQVTSDKDELVKNIIEMSKNNLQLEPQLEGKRQEVLYKYEQITEMKSAFETKMQRQHELSESCSLSALQARLKVAAHQAEEESEDIAEDFLEGKIEIDDFLTNFMEKRTLCHCRRSKEEKLQQSINTHG
ncbi:vacuolar protein sorting-associated protein 37A [Acipenser oxyrinchus oxyrinchus]|uniref:Vacuolar protein sorting-associated protein 37A n=1 Tax=Acipenser oxyrinchus oxyrinchus TaxID=40147 RepID=A0AAD8GHP7_ACIOX|nr:vacuolar protein sorting-associated protein 37A [Acipenser oxyrinchus oxyrinchus]